MKSSYACNLMRCCVCRKSPPSQCSGKTGTARHAASVLAPPLTAPTALTAIAPTRLSIVAATMDNRIGAIARSEEHTSELQSRPHLVCRLLLEKKKNSQDTV